MKYTLYYVYAKLKAARGKRLLGNTGIVYLSIVRWNLLNKRNIYSVKEKRRQADWGIDFCIEQYKNKIRKCPCYACCVCNQFTFFGKVNIRVKIFSVRNLHLVKNSIFVKHVT